MLVEIPDGRFQSTHLLRGGTRPDGSAPPPRRYFNPPTSCEVGLGAVVVNTPEERISIHPPPARWDLAKYFPLCAVVEISIHPPPARWDQRWKTRWGPSRYFNPPTSCEVGPVTVPDAGAALTFQSTHLLRGGTHATTTCLFVREISIHPPPARWDTTATTPG